MKLQEHVDTCVLKQKPVDPAAIVRTLNTSLRARRVRMSLISETLRSPTILLHAFAIEVDSSLAEFSKTTYHLRKAILSSNVQRCSPMLVGLVWVGSSDQQAPDTLIMPISSGAM